MLTCGHGRGLQGRVRRGRGRGAEVFEVLDTEAPDENGEMPDQGDHDEIGHMIDDDMYEERESKYAQGASKGIADADWLSLLYIGHMSRMPNDHVRNYLQKQRCKGLKLTMLDKANDILRQWEDVLQTPPSEDNFCEEWEPLLSHIAMRIDQIR